VRPQEDSASVLKNPAMGWVMYVDAFSSFPDADNYWDRQHQYAGQANILYVRAPWSELEPQEGRYAWQYDQNWIDLVEGAAGRDMQLAFRIYIDSQDSYRQATPQYVRDAGAVGYDSDGWTPYLDDPVFQDKFEQFIAAFGAEYDDPDRVAYVDGNGTGWWGEGHHIEFINPANINAVFDWLCRTYTGGFRHVLLGVQYQYNSWGWDNLDNVAIDRYGYVMRRDSLGCPLWFPQSEMDRIRGKFSAVPFYAENCYHSLRSSESWWRGDGYDSLRELFREVLDQALYCRANTLDLRIPSDTEAWFTEAPDMVQEFIERGGYRLVPLEISYPRLVRAQDHFLISHRWKNSGVGVLPNHTSQWNYKYKVAFALLRQSDDEVVSLTVDTEAEPSDWIDGTEFSYGLSVDFAGVSAGDYRLGCAIVDTTAGSVPGIKLAVQGARTADGWWIVGDIKVVK